MTLKRFATQVTLGDKKCLVADPAKYPKAAKKATSYRCSTGCDPGVAFVLMLKSDVDDLDKKEPHILKVTQVDKSGETPQSTDNEFKKLYFVRSERMNPGAEDDPNSALLVEMHDVRRLLRMTSAGDAQYNIRGIGIATDFLPETRDSGSDWTWQTMLDDLWDKMPSDLAGDSPDLPYTPDGKPEGWKFTGCSAWEAIHKILDKLYCTTAYDPAEGTFTFVELGKEQKLTIDEEEVDIDDYPGAITFNAEPMAGNSVDIPEKIRVWFPTWHDSYGANWDQAFDDDWDRERTAKSKDISTADDDAITGTIVDIWDDLSAEYDSADTLGNDSALTTRATEIKDKWLQNAKTTERHIVAIGFDSNVKPGSEIRTVLWRNWGEIANGSVTEFVTRPAMIEGMNRGGRPASHPQFLYHFTLTEDMGATTTKQASCTIYTADGTTRTEYKTGQTLYDPDNFLDGAVSGSSGPCYRQLEKFYALNDSCGTAP